jgi:arsenate reductase (thioredoxin)
MDKKRVLFLCTGNSCRSQLAEAIANAKFYDQWEAFSAGSHPAGYVHQLAIQSLAELGIVHQGRSTSIDEFSGQPFDLVVTLCDQAADECPVWLGQGEKIHLPFPDPAKTTGLEADKMFAIRSVRDGIMAALTKILSA